MEISCAFPTALDSPDHIVLAEELGYDRAWLYDTPQQSTDVWVTLALAAERTERIGLGPGVLVPGHGASRPVDVPVSIAALGPKAAAVARELGDGLYVTLALPEFAREFERVSYLFWGTIRDPGEDPASDRVRAAGGPGWALAYHGA